MHCGLDRGDYVLYAMVRSLIIISHNCVQRINETLREITMFSIAQRSELAQGAARWGIASVANG